MNYNHAISKLDIPARMLKLPISENGFPVPRFVAWVDGKPDFRAVHTSWLAQAVNQKLCWICGERLGKHLAFILGPMCALNRVNSEPPSHLECARFAVKACPFLAHPERKRNEHDLPDNRIEAPGIHVERNPGAMAIWITLSYRPFRTDGMGNPGILFSLGDPIALEWYARGRKATRDEIIDSIDSGLPLLREVAERDGPAAVEEFNQRHADAMALLPA
jgi:hypothetical protein